MSKVHSYFIYIYMLGTHLRLGLYMLEGLTQLADWMSNYIYAKYLQFIPSQVYPNLLSLHAPSFNKKTPYAPYGLLLLIL